MYDIISIPSPNRSSRAGQSPKGIVIHSIGCSFEDSIEIFTAHKVSAHYFIPQLTMRQIMDQYPELANNASFNYLNAVPVIKMVSESESAWHAGKSRWRGWNALPLCGNNLNACTIGIEFHAPGYNDIDAIDISNFVEYNDLQIATGAALIKDISKRWNIPSENLLAHSDIAFLREEGPSKTDPGPLFPWRKLYEQYNVGLFHLVGSNAKGLVCNIKGLQSALQAIGYFCPQSGVLDNHTKHCINAYRLRYMGESWRKFDGTIDDVLLRNIYSHPAVGLL